MLGQKTHVRQCGVVYEILCRGWGVSHIDESINFKRRLEHRKNGVAEGYTVAGALAEQPRLIVQSIHWYSAATIVTAKHSTALCF